MATTATALRDDIIAKIKGSAACATAAGVAALDWASTTRPRVVPMGTIGAVNRGRIPMAEVSTESQGYDNQVPQDGGGVLTIVNVRVHFNGIQGGDTRANADALLAACLAAARAGDYTAMGFDQVQAEVRGIGWLSLTAQLTIDNTYQSDYEA